jgi:phosphoribosylformylglycinamidine synthase I
LAPRPGSSGIRRPIFRGSIWSLFPAGFPSAIICAAGRWRRKARSWRRSALGVCNGFQILTVAGLLPGALLRNAGLRFLSMDTTLRVERADTVFTSHYQKGEVFRAPMAHGDGNYTADANTLDLLEGEGRVAFRYAEQNHNGSARAIAGIYSENLRVMGLMPHPEDLVDPLLGGTDGKPLFDSLAAA